MVGVAHFLAGHKQAQLRGSAIFPFSDIFLVSEGSSNCLELIYVSPTDSAVLPQPSICED